MRISTLHPRLVEYIPDDLKDGVLYISDRFRTCSHRCCCGCGEEVVTPLSAAEWSLTMEGATVSLWPSIGNWDYACRSHYVIRRNRVLRAKPMTAQQIASVQRCDSVDLERMVARENRQRDARVPSRMRVAPSLPKSKRNVASGRLGRLRSWLRRLFAL